MWLAVDNDGTELMFKKRPLRHNVIWINIPDGIELNEGTIKKLLGREMTWKDEPIQLPNSSWKKIKNI